MIGAENAIISCPVAFFRIAGILLEHAMGIKSRMFVLVGLIVLSFTIVPVTGPGNCLAEPNETVEQTPLDNNIPDKNNQTVTEVKPTVSYVFPYPGILPDHPLYSFKSARDTILLFFTRQPDKKSELYLLLSDKNMAMAELLWEKGEISLGQKHFITAERYLLQSVKSWNTVSNPKDYAVYADKLKKSLRKHEEILSSYQSRNRDESISRNIENALATNKQAGSLYSELK